MGVSHAECSKAFFKCPGAKSRLNFVDQKLKPFLPPVAYEKTWLQIYHDTTTAVKYRNALAHFDVFHITDADRVAATPQTAYRVIIAESHMNAGARNTDRVASLSIEMIEKNNFALRELAYQLIYFVVDHFPLKNFMGKGLLPLTEMQLIGFHRNPRPPEFPRPEYVAR